MSRAVHLVELAAIILGRTGQSGPMDIERREDGGGPAFRRETRALEAHLGPASIVGQLVLAACYFATAKLGLSLAFEAEQVTAVWPPTGIALAAVVLWGPRVWPAIVLGAFLANVTTNEPVLVATGIATGNLLEALLGAWLISRFIDTTSTNIVARVRGVLCLIALAALLSTTVAATIGATSLCLGGVQPWKNYSSLWVLWWLGDCTGALVFAPPLLAWGRVRSLQMSPLRAVEVMALSAATLFIGVFRFNVPTGSPGAELARILPVFPLVIWAALRFGPRGVSTLIVTLAMLAVWGTAHGRGQFAADLVEESLLHLQIFLATVAVTGLLMAAAIAEQKQAEAALVEANYRKDEFLAVLAHELRNPLAPVCHALEILQLGGGDDPAVAAVAVEMMERQVRHMVRLIDDLLDVSRVTRGTVQLRCERIELATVLRNAIETSRPLIDSHGHSLSVTMPSEPILLDADAVRLAQVFCNLLNNACKYTPQGGQVSLIAERSGDKAIVRVRDTGIGIPAKMLKHIFEMFMQVDRSLERTHGGLGIGLTLVDRLVALHGGSVEAHSEGQGRGSEFVVRLPIVQTPQPARAPSADPGDAQAAAAPCRILVADDNRDAALTLGTLLRMRGHEVRTTFDGLEACEVAADFRPDLVLLDIGMPRCNGYEAARQIRREPWGQDAVLIALTGWGQDQDKQLSKEAGFDHHLVKPVDPRQLDAVLGSPRSAE